MLIKKKILSLFSMSVLVLSVAACGSSNNNGGTTTTTGTAQQQQDVLALVQTIGGLTSDLFSQQSALVVQAQTIKAQSTIDCTNGGTVTISADGETITFANCVEGDTTIDGSFTLSEEGTTTTATWDFSISDGSDSFSIDGSISYDDSDGSLSMNLTSSFNGTTYTVVADLTISDDDLLNGTATFSVSGSAVVTCTFNDFDTDTATEADYEEACNI